MVRDGVQTDLRFYDGASRVVRTGPAGDGVPQGYATALNAGKRGQVLNFAHPKSNLAPWLVHSDWRLKAHSTM